MAARTLLRTVLEDLRAEGDTLDALIAGLPADRWALPTPADGWTVAHQVAHLAWSDEAAIMAIKDPGSFHAILADVAGQIDQGAVTGAKAKPADLLARWRGGRAALSAVLGETDAGQQVTWFGPPLNVTSLATVRLMETWAHGLDIADALGVEHRPTHRLRHIAYLGVRTRDHSFQLNNLTPPAPFRVELTGPAGEEWTWGPLAADQRVTGSALDFCKLTTRRVHRDDTDLVAVGADAERWLAITQSFAGPASPGRPRRPLVPPQER